MKESELYLERNMHLDAQRKLPFTENPLGNRAQPKRILIFGKIPDFVELDGIEIVHYPVKTHTRIVERAS